MKRYLIDRTFLSYDNHGKGENMKKLLSLSILVIMLFASCSGSNEAAGEIGPVPEFIEKTVTIPKATTEEAYATFAYAIQMPFIAGIAEKPSQDSYKDTIFGNQVSVARTEENGIYTFEISSKKIAAEVIYDSKTKSFDYRQLINASLAGTPIDYFVVTEGSDIRHDEATDSWNGSIRIYALMDHTENPAANPDNTGHAYSMTSSDALFHSDSNVTGTAIYSISRPVAEAKETEAVITLPMTADKIDDVISYGKTGNGSGSMQNYQLTYFDHGSRSYGTVPGPSKPEPLSRDAIIAQAQQLSPAWDLSGIR